MPQSTSNLFAYVRKISDFRPDVTAIVLFGLKVEGDDPVYLEIRFRDYKELQIEGDHLMLGLEDALESAEFEYGILSSDWRAMSEAEIQRIPIHCRWSARLASCPLRVAFCRSQSPRVLVKSDANDRSSRIKMVGKPVQYPVENNMKVRKALLTDAESVSKLLGQLGYQASPKLIRDKLEALEFSARDTVLLAQDGKNIIGVISLHVLELFHQPGRLGRITSLVIEDDFRGQGVGAMLVSAADAFFTEQLCVRAEVTSSDHRIQAYTFYQRQGYAVDERRFVKRYDSSGA
ncbi:GNAT family N-acetyltransferase [Pseudomonas mandelii]|uniref:GNAT family N-acetyltransferase n=1 Tax=Pseudomonas mandelii TaxID=75612 RepID=UPI0020A1DA8F|nr:GNAT family N-acetyltransferase [Pseudomonas mandelii]MCO8311775.1 GNAT family N-acetyltransferase [Pseudomonas mandelii]